MEGGEWGFKYLKTTSPLLFPYLPLYHMQSASRILPQILCLLESPCCPQWFPFHHDCPLSANDTESSDFLILWLARLWKGSACSWHKQLLIEAYFLSTSPSQKLPSLIAKNVTWSLIWGLQRIMKDYRRNAFRAYLVQALIYKLKTLQSPHCKRKKQTNKKTQNRKWGSTLMTIILQLKGTFKKFWNSLSNLYYRSPRWSSALVTCVVLLYVLV